VASKQKQVAVVTGAGRGIGASIAEALAEQGYALVIVSRTEAELKNIQALITQKYKIPVEIVVADLSQPIAVTQIETAIQKLGDWQVLVNNAGVCYQAEIKDLTDEQFEKMFAINVTAVFRLCKLAFHQMNAVGTIINIASVAGIYGVSKFKGLGPYAASKAAVIGLTEMIAQEGQLHGKNIRGYCISPGAVDTQMLKAIVSSDYEADLKPQDIAAQVIKLIRSRPADLNGKNIPIWSNANTNE
jgi:3-oxoacyl-[acyl-carrier protein] reductase